MKIHYFAPFSINEYLKDELEEKIKKIEDLNLRVSKTEVYFKLKEGSHPPNDKEIEIKIQVPKQILFAKSYSDTFEKAIPLAVDKMRKQMIKYKDSLSPKRQAH